jgi:hypothetical protein
MLRDKRTYLLFALVGQSACNTVDTHRNRQLRGLRNGTVAIGKEMQKLNSNVSVEVFNARTTRPEYRDSIPPPGPRADVELCKLVDSPYSFLRSVEGAVMRYQRFERLLR